MRDLCDIPQLGMRLTHDRAEAIRSMLAEWSFNLCKILCQCFRTAKAISVWILHDTMDLQECHLKWIAVTYSLSYKSERVPYSRFHLAALEEEQWKWVMVLSVLSAWVSVRILPTWASYTNQANNWHGKVADLHTLACSRNSESDWSSQRYEL
jgi:hypothetical protein